jgi:hypothetical protein
VKNQLDQGRTANHRGPAKGSGRTLDGFNDTLHAKKGTPRAFLSVLKLLYCSRRTRCKSLLSKRGRYKERPAKTRIAENRGNELTLRGYLEQRVHSREMIANGLSGEHEAVRNLSNAAAVN